MPQVLVDDVVVSENAANATITLRLSSPADAAATLNWTTRNGSASSVSGSDFVGGSGTVTFAVGESTKVLTIALANDATVEPTESFWVELSLPGASTLTLENSRVLVSVLDNDVSIASPFLSIDNAIVDELNGTATFAVSLDRASSSTVTVNYATSDLTALAGSDYTQTSGLLTFAPGTRVQTITVPIANDATSESVEYFAVTLASATGATIVAPVGTGVIGPSDATPVAKPNVWVSDAVASEADAYVEFTLWLDAPGTTPVSIDYNTSNGSASSTVNADFVGISGTVTFAAGQQIQTVRVPLTNDSAQETIESLWLSLSVASGSSATLGRNSATATILDNDQAAGTPVMSVGIATVDERSGMAAVTVTLDRPSLAAVSASWSTAADSASAGSDFVSRSGVVGFAPGETVKTVLVPINEDNAAEGGERFWVNLAAPTGATLGTSNGAVIIGANDAPTAAKPTLYIDDVTVSEEDGVANIVLRLDAPSAGVISLNYSTSNGAASYVVQADYVSTYGVVSFAPGQTFQTVQVPLTNDLVTENTETFSFGISVTGSSAAVSLARDSATVSIIDNDPATPGGTPIATVGEAWVDEYSGGFARFVVTLDRPASTTVSVHYATADASALAGQDYTATSGTLVFAPGDTSQTILVPITDDALQEGAEQLRLTLDTPVGVTLAQSSAVAVIGANDAPTAAKPTLYMDDVTVSEADGVANIVLRLDAPSAGVISLNYSTSNGAASYVVQADYVSTYGAVSFAPGQTLQTVQVPLTNDLVTENTETFSFGISVTGSSAAVSLARDSATVSIIDNDPAISGGTPIATVGEAWVDEHSGGFARFVVTLDRPASTTVSVHYATADASALAGQDYTATSGTLVFAPGDTSQTILVPITDDALQEGAEQLRLTLDTPVGVTLAQSSAVAVIGANDAPTAAKPTLYMDDVTVSEADGVANIVLRLDAPSAGVISLNYSTSNGAASYVVQADYVSTYGVVSFAPGQTFQTVQVPLTNDLVTENTETFSFGISVTGSSAAVSLARDSATVSIIDNDPATPGGTPIATVGEAWVDEYSGGFARFVVTLDRPASTTVSVHYATADASALAGQDYTATSGTLVFAPGDTSQTILVPITDDALQEGAEQLRLTLDTPVGVTLAQSSAVAVIGANDAPTAAKPTLYMDDVTVSEADGVANIVLRLDAPSAGVISLNYSTSNGAASYVVQADYVSTYGAVSFAPGQTLQTVQVPLTNDLVTENTETFSFGISVTGSSAAVSLARDSATVSIIDNDPAIAGGTPSVSVRDVVVDETAGYATFAVVLDRPSAATTSVGYGTVDLTAQAGQDYYATSGTLSFAPGDTSQMVTVQLLDDFTRESFEQFVLRLSTPSGLTLGDATGRATLGPSDQPTLATPTVYIADAIGGEIDGTQRFTVWLSAASSAPITLNYSTGSATATGSDFVSASGSITFAPGSMTASVPVSVINDALVEGTETYKLNLSVAGGSTATLNRAQATGTIVDNDSSVGGITPAISIASAVAYEHDILETFAVTLDRASASTVTVAYATAGGTAQTGLDFNAASGTVTFLPGETAKTIQISAIDDQVLESDEQFTVLLSSPSGATLATSTATGTIVNDDIAGLLINGTAAADSLTGGTGSDTINGLAGNDILRGLAGDDYLDGGDGLDMAAYASPRAQYTAHKLVNGDIQISGPEGVDTLHNVERAAFSDINLGFDVDGIGGTAYRLYKAAFDRTPDAGGLGFWMYYLDRGFNLVSAADNFLNSDEFRAMYGPNPTNNEFVRLLYQHVMHRDPDAEGYKFWNDAMTNAGGIYGHQWTKGEVLTLFADSAENKALVVGVIQDGFEYAPFQG